MANANEYRLAQLLAEKQGFELGKFEQGELRECIEEDWGASPSLRGSSGWAD